MTCAGDEIWTHNPHRTGDKRSIVGPHLACEGGEDASVETFPSRVDNRL